ncbi:type III-B CRISPR module-associated protein Cmr5 [Thermodesulfatator atlanticus]|uniref:type III-B CRISPR module-associated protein Cmr5 n=1 Tax=Thermodesulfatator atlanticus TaxID=501497 RepID=UPI0003B65F2D|nr:type III-B CRISPR module-associated protein Cmr5 [Thermodesulfatator atlanticus]
MKVHRMLEQQRAREASLAVAEAKEKTKFSEYVSLVKKFPALVVRNGLGPAVAFLLSKGKGKNRNSHALLARQLEDWLCRKAPHSPFKGKDLSLIEAIAKGSSQEYLMVSREALAYLKWLKLLASAEGKDEKEKQE